jgi:hypothetical protein
MLKTQLLVVARIFSRARVESLSDHDEEYGVEGELRSGREACVEVRCKFVGEDASVEFLLKCPEVENWRQIRCG